MDPILRQSALDLTARLAAGTLTSEALLRATYDRIEEVNGQVNAIVALRDYDDALKDAREADRIPAKGPLHGLPMAIKDLAQAKGLPTSMGSPLCEGQVAQTSDVMVQRLFDAGAIFIGKTNTPEFGLGSHTYNPVFGATQNALEPGNSAGGSSGGAAVALAMHMTALADGSDMMGSLRNPAGWNGVYGLRPTWGLVPSEPKDDSFLHQLSTNGPMARSPSDLALLLSVMAGPDPRQPHGRGRFQAPEPLTPARNARIAWLGDWDGAYPMEDGVLEACSLGLQIFADDGHGVENLAAPFPAQDLWTSWTALRSWSVASSLGVLYRNEKTRAGLKPEALWEIENGLALSAAQVNSASVLRSKWFRRAAELFETYDVLALPTAQCFPFPIDWAWPKAISGHAMDTYHRWMEVVVPASLIGLPAVAVPIPGPRPMGLQFIGRRGSDAKLLAIAESWHATMLGGAEAKTPALGPGSS